MLTDKVLGYVCIGLAVALLASLGAWWLQVTMLEAKVTDLETQVRSLTNKLEIAVEANKRLSDGIELQNKAIAKWKQEAFARETQAASALQAAETENKRWAKRYNELFSRPPANPDDPLASIDTRIDEYLVARKEK